MGRFVVLLTSPRVAPGLMTSSAWQLLATAELVCCASVDSPLAKVVTEAGTEVHETAPNVRALTRAANGRTVVWLAGPDGDPTLCADVAAEVVRRAEGSGDDGDGDGDGEPELEVMTGSYDLPGSRLLDLVAVMDRLRRSCPWDQEQDHQSLVQYLVEETYETVDAIERDDPTDLREELGDVLLQVVFHARIAEEDALQPWSIDDVAAGIVDKLISRHPHVFAEVEVRDAAEVEVNWRALKATEKRRTSILDGIPMSMPALTLAGKLLSRAGDSGRHVDRPAALPAVPVTVSDAEQLGALLLAVVAAARSAGFDAEQALRAELRRFADDVRAAERR